MLNRSVPLPVVPSMCTLWAAAKARCASLSTCAAGLPFSRAGAAAAAGTVASTPMALSVAAAGSTARKRDRVRIARPSQSSGVGALGHSRGQRAGARSGHGDDVEQPTVPPPPRAARSCCGEGSSARTPGLCF